MLLFLLLSSAADAVQATETGAGEGHGLPDALHPRRSTVGGGQEREREKEEEREGGREALKHCSFNGQSTKISGTKEEDRGSHFFIKKICLSIDGMS